MKIESRLLVRVVSIPAVLLGIGLQAATFRADFNNNQLPPGSSVLGHAGVQATGGVTNSGVLRITRNLNDQLGTFYLEDLDGGAPVYGFRATFMALVGRGTSVPADGWSFNFAPDIPDTPFGEWAGGTGISVCFDIYDNVDGNPNNNTGEAPAINIRVRGQQVTTRRILPLSDLVNSAFVPVTIAVNANGSLDVVVNGKTHVTNYFLPGYQPLSGARFAIGARTGGLNAYHMFDNLEIETYLTPAPGLVEGPQDLTVVAQSPATFSLVVNNADGAAIQWLRDGQPIPGATELNYTLLAASLADSGAKFSARITGGGATLTTGEAALKVVTIELPATPTLSFDFNDGTGMPPAGATLFGSANIGLNGGVGDSGVLMLTLAENDLNGALLVDDPEGGAPVYGVAARFALRLGGGTEIPADGFSFDFGTDLPDGGPLMVEEGVGTGLSVTFDTYDNLDNNPNNGTGEAPAVGIKYGGALVAEKLVKLSLLRTGDGFADVIIRLTSDGLIDVVWNGIVLFDRVRVPGFASISGGRFGFYGRTGGLNDNHWVDDINLYTYLTAPLRITTQPTAQMVLVGKPATFTVGVSLPDQATYQWYRNDALISGATEPTYTLPAAALADDGARFKVVVGGAGLPLTSDQASLTVVNLTPPVNPQLSFSFDDGAVPAGAEIAGTALVDSFGGVDDSGVLKVTINENGQAGGFRSSVVASGAQALDLILAADVLAGGGTPAPADGFSINLANDVPLIAPGDAENGGGSGLTITFDTYDNADGDPWNGVGEAPAIEIRYAGAVVASKLVPVAVINNDFFKPLLVHVTEAGVVDLAFGDDVIYHNLVIPGYQPMSSIRVAIYARTGGANANHFFDNVRLGVRIPETVTITRHPAEALVLDGQPARFTVEVSNPNGVTYQWLKGGIPIPGAVLSAFLTPAQTLADEGASYSVQVRGPNNTLTSDSARVLVLERFGAGANPVYDFNFDDGQLPPNSMLFGTAYLDTTGGVGGSPVLKLTDAIIDQAGSWLLDTPPGVEVIHDVTLTWRMLVGGGTEVPADGFSFVLGAEIADGPFGEDGVGNGVVVSFDIYDNGQAEAPAIDVRYGGLDVSGRKFPLSALATGDQYADVGVRVNRNGTIDLYYANTAVFRGLPLPEFQPFTAGRFGWGARTGGLTENQWLDNLRISVNTQAQASKITIAKNPNGTVTVSWTGGGVLQVAPTVSGPWTDLTGTVSPFIFQPQSQVLFGRIKQ